MGHALGRQQRLTGGFWFREEEREIDARRTKFAFGILGGFGILGTQGVRGGLRSQLLVICRAAAAAAFGVAGIIEIGEKSGGGTGLMYFFIIIIRGSIVRLQAMSQER